MKYFNTVHGPYPCKTVGGEKCYRIEWQENGKVQTRVSTYGEHRSTTEAQKILRKVKEEIYRTY